MHSVLQYEIKPQYGNTMKESDMPGYQQSALKILEAFQKSLDNVEGAVYLVSETGGIQHCNKAFCLLTGMTRRDITSKSIFELNPNVNQENWPELWRLCFKEKTRPTEVEIRTKSGETVKFKASVNCQETGSMRFLSFSLFHESVFQTMALNLSKSEETLNNVINSIGDPIFVKDRQHRWVLLNNAFCMAMGHSSQDLLGKTDYDFFPKHEADVFWKKDEVVFNTGKENINEEEFTEGGGATKVIMTKKTLYSDNRGNKYIVGVFRDITEKKRIERQLKLTLEKVQSLSLRDELTKLYNRRGFITLGRQQIKLANRNKTPIALLFADMDNMKIINDRHGHNTGDMALCDIASLLSQTFRDSDITARIGGDEFVVMAINANPKDAKTLIMHLQEKIAVFNEKKSDGYELSLSIGMAFYDWRKSCPIEELLERADQAMYVEKVKRKKRAGK